MHVIEEKKIYIISIEIQLTLGSKEKKKNAPTTTTSCSISTLLLSFPIQQSALGYKKKNYR